MVTAMYIELESVQDLNFTLGKQSNVQHYTLIKNGTQLDIIFKIFFL